MPDITSILDMLLCIITESPRGKINTCKEMVSGIWGVVLRYWQLEKDRRVTLERSLILLVKIVHFQHV